MSDYIPQPYPRWMFHEVLPDRVAKDAAEAAKMETQGYTRERREGRAALLAKLEYYRAEVKLLEAKLGITPAPAVPQPTASSDQPKRGRGRPPKNWR